MSDQSSSARAGASSRYQHQLPTEPVVKSSSTPMPPSDRSKFTVTIINRRAVFRIIVWAPCGTAFEIEWAEEGADQSSKLIGALRTHCQTHSSRLCVPLHDATAWLKYVDQLMVDISDERKEAIHHLTMSRLQLSEAECSSQLRKYSEEERAAVYAVAATSHTIKQGRDHNNNPILISVIQSPCRHEHWKGFYNSFRWYPCDHTKLQSTFGELARHFSGREASAKRTANPPCHLDVCKKFAKNPEWSLLRLCMREIAVRSEIQAVERAWQDHLNALQSRSH